MIVTATIGRKPALERGERKPAALPVNVSGVPEALRDLRRWVCWRYVRRQDKKGSWKWTKLPVDPKTGRAAKSTKPATWGTFEQALACYRADGLDGAGFVLGDGIAGIDLDDVLDPDTGVLEPWAANVVRQLDSYTEISPSGTGVKVFVTAAVPTGGNRRGPVEVYDAGRYFAVTGAHLDGTPRTVNARQEALGRVHQEYVALVARPLAGEGGHQADRGQLNLNDEQLLAKAKAAKNGEKFTELWTGGLGGHASDSEADLALAGLLAFYTGPDPERLDRLFRQSARCRPKWEDREDYRAATIRKALEGRSEFYDPRRPAPAANGAAGGAEAQGVGPEDGGDVHLTDLGNARRVVASHGADVRYCFPWKRWLVWDGARWKEDATGEIIRRVKATQGDLYRWAAARLAELGAADGGDDRKVAAAQLTAVLNHCLKWEDAKRVAACVDLARSEPGIPVLPDQLDADPFLLNVLNGTLDLRTGTLREHRRADLLTKLAPVEYHADAPCPTWEACLSTWMDGNADLTGYLQRVMGYCLTGDVSEQSLWFLYGVGQNGKSTFLGTLLALLGDYAIQAVGELLMVKAHEQHPTERADLFGRRLVATIETDEGKRIAEALMKQLTGGDKVRARRMRQDFFEFTPSHKLFLAANHKPTVRGTDFAVWRRIKLVPFTVTIGEDRKDKALPEKLRAELPGILAWAVRGCRDWQEHGLGEPDEVRQATAAYQAEQDTLAGFLAECCLLHPEARCRPATLFEAYQQWSGDKLLTQNAFGRRLTDRGYTQDKGGRGVRYWSGIGLRDADTGGGVA